jgi:hypothetical protein
MFRKARSGVYYARFVFRNIGGGDMEVSLAQKLLGLALAACFTLCTPAAAGVIQILDLTDIATATDSGTTNGRFSPSPASCATNEECIFTIHAPTGTASIAGGAFFVNMYEDASMTVVSDTLQVTDCTANATCWQFDSDREAPLSPLQAPDALINIVENGSFQTVVSLTYRDANAAIIGNDTIQIQSDLDPTGTPEPSTGAIALGGLALLGGWMLQRRLAMRTA